MPAVRWLPHQAPVRRLGDRDRRCAGPHHRPASAATPALQAWRDSLSCWRAGPRFFGAAGLFPRREPGAPAAGLSACRWHAGWRTDRPGGDCPIACADCGPNRLAARYSVRGLASLQLRRPRERALRRLHFESRRWFPPNCLYLHRRPLGWHHHGADHRAGHGGCCAPGSARRRFLPRCWPPDGPRRGGRFPALGRMPATIALRGQRPASVAALRNGGRRSHGAIALRRGPVAQVYGAAWRRSAGGVPELPSVPAVLRVCLCAQKGMTTCA